MFNRRGLKPQIPLFIRHCNIIASRDRAGEPLLLLLRCVFYLTTAGPRGEHLLVRAEEKPDEIKLSIGYLALQHPTNTQRRAVCRITDIIH